MLVDIILHDKEGNTITRQDEWQDHEYKLYLWTEGNFSCDCNRSDFLYGNDEGTCGTEAVKIKIVNRTTNEVLYDEGDFAKERVTDALEIARRWGGIDGNHHRAYTIDQMVRALTGCSELAENAEYLEWIKQYQDGENGPQTYEWDVGIAP